MVAFHRRFKNKSEWVAGKLCVSSARALLQQSCMSLLKYCMFCHTNPAFYIGIPEVLVNSHLTKASLWKWDMWCQVTSFWIPSLMECQAVPWFGFWTNKISLKLGRETWVIVWQKISVKTEKSKLVYNEPVSCVHFLRGHISNFVKCT